MRVVGILLIVLGIGVMMYGFSLDPSVASTSGLDIGRVNNLGLMNDKQNILFIGGVMSLGGCIFYSAAYIVDALHKYLNIPKA